MNYRSIADASRAVANNLHKLPEGIDLVVGIPRSGMLVAPMIALNLNIKFCDISAFMENKKLGYGLTRVTKTEDLEYPHQAKKILVVDDSVSSGTSMVQVKELLEPFLDDFDITFGAVYACKNGKNFVDTYLEMVPHPRYFEWNLMHRKEASTFCVDIDGVLCFDPSREQNDDGENYKKFMLEVDQLAHPSMELGYLVTSRLEKYRPETEEWLASKGIKYKELYMNDLPSAAERQRLGRYATFKAEVYKSLPDSRLFIESEEWQARDIAKIAGKHALDFTNQTLFDPQVNLASVTEKLKYSLPQKIKNRVNRYLTKVK